MRKLKVKMRSLIKKVFRIVALFIINSFLSTTRFFSLKRFLLNISGIKIGKDTKVVGSILIVSMLSILSSFTNLDFILNRFNNISQSAKESGRKEIWDKAFQVNKMNPLGNGMNAPLELIDTGNIHNCYVRFLLTMGYPFTILTLLCLLILILFVAKDKKVPKPLVGFLFGYILANYGEDFFVGVGSSMFIYVVMTIGLISFYSFKKEDVF